MFFATVCCHYPAKKTMQNYNFFFKLQNFAHNFKCVFLCSDCVLLVNITYNGKNVKR